MAPGGCEGAPPALKPQIGCGPGGKIYVDMPTSQPRRTHNCSAMPMSAGDPPAPCCHCGHLLNIPVLGGSWRATLMQWAAAQAALRDATGIGSHRRVEYSYMQPRARGGLAW